VDSTTSCALDNYKLPAQQHSCSYLAAKLPLLIFEVGAAAIAQQACVAWNPVRSACKPPSPQCAKFCQYPLFFFFGFQKLQATNRVNAIIGINLDLI
jgi:hypothetical protein